MAGFYLMHRGWMTHATFRNSPYDERSAWIWLIENAAWKDTSIRVDAKMVPISRGQILVSLRYLATAWKWHRNSVQRFLRLLVSESMIGTETGTGQTLITISNYATYQAEQDTDGTDAGTKTGRTRDADGTKKKEVKQGKQEETPLSGSGHVERARDTAKQMMLVWVEECGDILSRPKGLLPTRTAACVARMRDLGGDVEAWRAICQRVRRSEFLTGKWRATFDWVLKPSNFVKIQEGNYDNRDSAEPLAADSGPRAPPVIKPEYAEWMQRMDEQEHPH